MASADTLTDHMDALAEALRAAGVAPDRVAGILASAQAVEHYEIARYGTLRDWARELTLNSAVSALERTLGEEQETDQILTELADDIINQEAEAA